MWLNQNLTFLNFQAFSTGAICLECLSVCRSEGWLLGSSTCNFNATGVLEEERFCFSEEESSRKRGSALTPVVAVDKCDASLIGFH